MKSQCDQVKTRNATDGKKSWGNFARWMVAQLRRWPSRSMRRLRLEETLALGERRFVAVVEFEQHRFLIGGTATSLSLLAELECRKTDLSRAMKSEREEDQEFRRA